jgi:hypothetical protein
LLVGGVKVVVRPFDVSLTCVSLCRPFTSDSALDFEPANLLNSRTSRSSA